MIWSWFSPLPPRRCVTGDAAALLLPLLAERVELRVWTDQEDWELPRSFDVRRYDPEEPPLAELNRADVTLFHIGEEHEIHAPIWRLSRSHPGVVALHAERLHGLLRGFLGADAYVEAVARLHGRSGRRAAAEALASPASDLDGAYPLAGLVAEGALGMVVPTVDLAAAGEVGALPARALASPVTADEARGYADGLVSLVAEAVVSRPRWAERRLARRVAAELATWSRPVPGTLSCEAAEQLREIAAEFALAGDGGAVHYRRLLHRLRAVVSRTES